MEDLREIKFDIVRRLGTLAEGNRSWRKELNLVAWNDREPKLDLREWNEDHTRMGKGVTMTREEGARLYELLESYLKS